MGHSPGTHVNAHCLYPQVPLPQGAHHTGGCLPVNTHSPLCALLDSQLNICVYPEATNTLHTCAFKNIHVFPCIILYVRL